MTPKQEAALRMAREALEESHPEAYRHIINAIREALAEQPVQPCGYPYCGCNSKAWCKVEQQSGIKQVIELYDSPEQPAQQQEPVATWENKYGMKEWQVHALRAGWSLPASKPWVGLTDEEVDECYYWKSRQWTTDELVRHVEAKLREKNA